VGFIDSHILTLMTFIPLLGGALILCVPKGKDDAIKGIAAVASFIPVLLAARVFSIYDRGLAGVNVADQFQFVEKYSWIPNINVEYFVGADGISVPMILLTALLSFLAVIGSFGIEKKIRGYMALFLLLETGMMGTFIALDFFLFYVFWEVMLLPMYFLIGVWGGQRRIYAAVKLFLYTFAGSVLMLVGILALCFHHQEAAGYFTTDLSALYAVAVPPGLQLWLFAAFSLAFAFKVPLFPFHTWLPDAHVEAPTAGSVILAAVLLKMGTYGFLRFSVALFPAAAAKFAPVIAFLAVIGIVYGALVSMAQEDVKKLVAYSSVSHLGFVMLGLFAFNVQGIEGGILQMVNHGVSTGALFLLVGMLYERRHTRQISDFGGLSRVMPVFALCFMAVTLSSIGLPGTNGFVGEFLILLGAFQARPVLAVISATGVVLAAVYMLRMFQRVMFGKVTREENLRLPDLNGREVACLLPILALVFWIGVYPQPFLRRMDASVQAFAARFEAGKQAAPPGALPAAPKAPSRAGAEK